MTERLGFAIRLAFGVARAVLALVVWTANARMENRHRSRRGG